MYHISFESYSSGYFISHISIYEGSYGFQRNEFKTQKIKMSNNAVILLYVRCTPKLKLILQLSVHRLMWHMYMNVLRKKNSKSYKGGQLYH